METARRRRSRRPRRDLASNSRLISLVCWSLLTTTTVPAMAGPPDLHPIAFRDVAAEAGVAFRFEDGSRGRHDLPEIMGGGVALIDGDGDGWLDIVLCN